MNDCGEIHNVDCSMSELIIDLKVEPQPFAFKHSISCAVRKNKYSNSLFLDLSA